MIPSTSSLCPWKSKSESRELGFARIGSHIDFVSAKADFSSILFAISAEP